MPDFTQGNWEYYERLGIICNETRGIAMVYEAGNDKVYCRAQSKEGKANACLIATAPEMYALLERFARCTNEDDMFDMMEDARKLLARIDGKEVVHE